MQLVATLRELPLVQMGALNVQPFKRLARLADAHGSMSTARIQSLATRLSVVLPSDNGSSETERAKWVWQLAVLERSVTIWALGYLKAAQADGKWDETVAALGDTGRFTVPWMSAARAAKHAASAAAAAAAAAAGTGFETIPILGAVTHVMATVPATVDNAVAKQFAYAMAGLHGITLAGTASDVWKNAMGLALQRVMQSRNYGLDKLPVLSADVPGALSALLNYLFPPWVRQAAFPCCHDITIFAIVVISHTTHKTEGSPRNVALQKGTRIRTNSGVAPSKATLAPTGRPPHKNFPTHHSP